MNVYDIFQLNSPPLPSLILLLLPLIPFLFLISSPSISTAFSVAVTRRVSLGLLMGAGIRACEQEHRDLTNGYTVTKMSLHL